LPIVVLVTMLPQWAERRHAATVAAREAARELVREWPASDPDRTAAVAREVAAAHGVEARAVRVATAGVGRGEMVRVEVEVTMPAIAVMGMHAGEWRYTAVSLRRVDDYRSR
jgi:hypothetical protein